MCLDANKTSRPRGAQLDPLVLVIETPQACEAFAAATRSLALHGPKHQVSPKRLAKVQTIQERCLVLDAHVDIVIPSTSMGMFGADEESLATPDRLRPGGIGVAVMCVAAG
jgi:hypothetical protein